MVQLAAFLLCPRLSPVRETAAFLIDTFAFRMINVPSRVHSLLPFADNPNNESENSNSKIALIFHWQSLSQPTRDLTQHVFDDV